MPENENGRPGKGGHMSPTTITDGSSVVLRCCVCGHIITSAASIRAGIGQSCRRRLYGALRGAEPEVVAAVLAAIANLSGVRR